MQSDLYTDGMSYQDPIQTLIESFSALADEVQNLIDRKTILEHKLRFSHEQYQYLADKYAPSAPEISETLAKLQLPPDLHQLNLTSSTFVPLPKRGQSGTSNHQIALVIREGRKVVQQLAASADASKSGDSSKDTSTRPTVTTMTTVLEQDFTVEGRKGKLGCPFSATKPEDAAPQVDETGEKVEDPTPHQSGDPICAAMFEETMSQPAPDNGATAKCPIRFLDQHSPEEIAHYVETHKHQIPRSHEVCVKRYQKNQEQIKKLDAKYGNLVSMINDLSKLHQPMLPSADGEVENEVDRASNERVETWAQEVRASAAQDPERTETLAPEETDEDLERESHFERRLKEVRVGESPSRPWGISLPVYDVASNTSYEDERPATPPAAPVRMSTTEPSVSEPAKAPQTRVPKCPFDHTKLNLGAAVVSSPQVKEEEKVEAKMERPFTPVKGEAPSSGPPRPAFISPESSKTATNHQGPQMVFTGPVFIGYPMEQAMQFMQQLNR